MKIRRQNIKIIKSYSLFESKEEETIFNKLPISKEDIKDIFIELEDMDYKIKMSENFLTKSGHTFKSNKGISEYYPVISISINKLIDDFGDEINWDGGVYYEEKQEVLDIISNSVAALKSHLSGKARVLVAIRSMNDINIRIVLPFVVNSDEISLEDLNEIANKVIDNYRGFNRDANFSNLINLYHIFTTTSIVFKTFSFDIEPIVGTGYVVSKDSATDKIVDKILKNNQTDNKEQLMSIYNTIVRDILSEVNKKYEDVKLRVISASQPIYQFYINDKILFSVNPCYYEFRWVDVPVGKKTIFNRKKQRIQLYKLYVKLDFKFDQ